MNSIIIRNKKKPDGPGAVRVYGGSSLRSGDRSRFAAVFALWLVSILLIPGCGSDEPVSRPHKEPEAVGKTFQRESVPVPSPARKEEGKVLVEVNGSRITSHDLQEALLDLLGPEEAAKADIKTREKVLRGMMAGRAIAQAMEAELDQEALSEIKRKVAAYRENLLVQEYLKRHIQLKPISHEMILEYYKTHPEKFGARDVRIYEMVHSNRPMKTKERDALFALLKRLRLERDWEKQVREWKRSGHPLVYREGELSEVMDPEVLAIFQPLALGEASPVTFLHGDMYIVRIVSQHSVPPRPFGEVSEDIRRIMSAMQIKEALEQAVQQILPDADIVYKDETREP